MRPVPGRRDKAVAFLYRERHRLFDEDMLAGSESGERLWRMLRISCGDQNRVHCGIGQNFIVIGGAIGRAESLGIAFPAGSVTRVNGPEFYAIHFIQYRQMFPFRQIPGSNNGDSKRLALRSPGKGRSTRRLAL